MSGVNLIELSRAGSLFVSRPTMFDYYTTREERVAGSERLWQMLRSGAVKVEIGQRFALEDAADAHRALEASETVGSTLLMLTAIAHQSLRAQRRHHDGSHDEGGA